GNEYSGTNLEKANNYYQKQIDISKEIGADERMVEGSMNKGNILLLQHKLDSAKTYLFNALLSANKSGYLLYKGYILRKIGDLYLQHLQVDSAKYYYRYAIESNTKEYNLTELGRANIVFAKLYNGLQQPDSIMHYARTAFNIAIDLNDPYILASSAGLMSDAYNMLGHTDSAFAYQRISKKLSDSLNTAKIEKITQFQNMGFEEQQRLEKEAQQNKDAKTRITTIALFSGLALVALLAIIFYRNNRQKQKANTVLEKTLSNLKSTQTQLVQSEKMASLGELTAGIAHEIQNPLNFVNNFSEVSNELIDEMNLELDKGDINEAKIISKDIKQNLEKINHHGKRADAIVKGMLQHSQSSSGKKEPTDINALCDEYLRLSYHGLRAKDKSFNATIKTDFDESLSADEAGIGKINIIPQDIGRVILNLINNAFYACAERSRSAVAEKQKQNNPGYEPTVTVSTRLVISPSPIGSGQAGGQRGVEIKVSDNGKGIPQKVLDKIFQPFFTTKPTGQGTGLGLSLAYDIIKANGGEIKVETLSAEAIAQAGTEKVGSAFIIHLPIV
ncbi:MAG: ATP-binding protein, partial [Ferruginibacter sp.]